MTKKKTEEVSTPVPGRRNLLDKILALSAPPPKAVQHLNVKLQDAAVRIWSELCAMLPSLTASRLIRESVRLRALFASWDHENKKVKVLVDGKEVDIYTLVELTRTSSKKIK